MSMLTGMNVSEEFLAFMSRNALCAIGAGNLGDVEAVVHCYHEPCQGWVAEDGIVRQRDVGNIKVEAFCPVVLLSAEGDGQANLSDGHG
jgi:hypothetical protein